MKKLLDLRFVIGVFFAIVGILLTVYYLFSSKPPDSSSVNIWCGVVFMLFGVVMIALSYLNKNSEEQSISDLKNDLS